MTEFLTPAYSLEAEMSVLGAMFLSERAAKEVCDLLQVDDFYRPAHGLIYSAMQRLVRVGQPVDFLTVVESLKSKGQLGEVGGDDYLIQVAEYCPSPANSGYYAELVKTKSLQRAIRELSSSLATRAVDMTQQEIAQEVARLVQVANTGVQRRTIALRDVPLSERSASGVATGIACIDGLTGVGLPNGQPVCIAAETKGGKTSMMLQIAWHIATHGGRVYYAPFADLSHEQIKRRILKQLCGWSDYPTRTDYLISFNEALEEVNDVFGAGSAWQFYDSRNGGDTIESLAADLRRAHAEEPFTAVFADYIQRIGTSTIDARSGTVARTEHVSRELARLAADLGVPVVFGSQVTKQADGRKMTKYAQAIEEDAGLALIVDHEDTESTTFESASLHCLYNRFGKSGVKGALRWDVRRLRFVE